ncbi:DUF4180 domain-containing protein [Pseudomonas vanderleydeniana]|uniref:DUF4180 domain-containing protein n=1 Tax=Pseudomonas vanderleydeniana TaxID=2745495 RepID=A0A9E6TUX5_9PSED|nr:DUF4180 domain-containing protein [Pseudomonas vanderleydeniana]QXI30750.1 DUF4180 domain-containing protein [Pseudomonas vanderleydeniana]
MSENTLIRMGSVVVLAWADSGAVLACEQDAQELIAVAWETGASLLAIPVGRLAPAFFDLRSGLAGVVLQKFVNYRLRVAIIGEIAVYTRGSEALAEFVSESNAGRSVWFLPSRADLQARLLLADQGGLSVAQDQVSWGGRY